MDEPKVTVSFEAKANDGVTLVFVPKKKFNKIYETQNLIILEENTDLPF